MRALRPHSRKTIPTALGRISAGPALEIGDDFAELDINELVTFGREGGFLALTVTGDSRAPEIQPGNIVFIDTWAEPRPGDLIAARVKGLVCLKEFRPMNHGLRLVSSNKNYAPIEVHESDDFQILGVYAGHLGLRRR